MGCTVSRDLNQLIEQRPFSSFAICKLKSKAVGVERATLNNNGHGPITGCLTVWGTFEERPLHGTVTSKHASRISYENLARSTRDKWRESPFSSNARVLKSTGKSSSLESLVESKGSSNSEVQGLLKYLYFPLWTSTILWHNREVVQCSIREGVFGWFPRYIFSKSASPGICRDCWQGGHFEFCTAWLGSFSLTPGFKWRLNGSQSTLMTS